MPDLSPKLGIKLPFGNENVTRDSFIENWNIIDTEAQKEIEKSDTTPNSPILDDLWLDTKVVPHVLKRFDGSGWLIVGGSAFSILKIGSTEIIADSSADTLEFTAGTSIILTPDATSDKVTISVNAADFESPVGAQMKADVTRKDGTKEFIVEVRTSDPVSPAIGRMWVRSDL